MIPRVLSQRLVLLVIGLAAGSGILIPASYGSLHPVTSSEIQDGTIQSVDIGTSQVKAADIAADAVGASELQGVTKLIFGKCNPDEAVGIKATPGGTATASCNVSGVDSNDAVIATLKANGGENPCFDVSTTQTFTGRVVVILRNNCPFDDTFEGGDSISLLIFDK